jgi:type VI secretion system secreted protein VgrG
MGAEELYVQSEKDLKVLVKDNRDVTVRDGDDSLTVKAGNRSVKVNSGNDSLEALAGNISVKADAGAIAIEALQSITLTVGTSKVTLTPAGVTIEGIKISAKADLMTEVSGNATVKVTGGVIMLN